MSDLTSLFSGIDNAKALGGFTPNLELGNHTVVLKRFNVKTSQKDGTKIAEADFGILESDTDTVNATKGWPWFIGATGFQGEYAKSRLKDFAEAVQKCIGDSSAPSATIAALADARQAGRGLVLKCHVFNGKPRKDGNGFYQEVKWYPITQTLEEMAAMRAKLDGAGTAAPAVTQTVQQTVAPVQTTPAAGVAGMSGLLANLGKKP